MIFGSYCAYFTFQEHVLSCWLTMQSCHHFLFPQHLSAPAQFLFVKRWRFDRDQDCPGLRRQVAILIETTSFKKQKIVPVLAVSSHFEERKLSEPGWDVLIMRVLVKSGYVLTFRSGFLKNSAAGMFHKILGKTFLDDTFSKRELTAGRGNDYISKLTISQNTQSWNSYCGWL